ncbi:hypothetical protein FO519_005562 [Halicephalobus sp. NKZ332]|nr:hypothetical protein FO519_005562 [Halicephalobus sp. NKZ332]
MVEDLSNSSCGIVANNQSKINDSMSRMSSNGTNNHGHVGYMLNNYLSKNVQKFTYMSAGTAPISEIKKKMGNPNANGMSVIEMEPISTPPKISTCRRKEGDHIYRPGDMSILKASNRGQDQPRRRVHSERGRRENGFVQYPPYPNIFMKSNPVFASSIPFSVPQYASGAVGNNGETLRYMAPHEAFYYGQM